MIRRFEGLRLTPYLCSAGVPTIGYGHTGPEVRIGGPRITRSLAETFLFEDASLALRMAIKLSPCLVLHPQRAAAVADFIFNLGDTRYRASTLRRRVNELEWGDAADEIRRWVWGGGKRLPGLVKRRAAEAVLLA